MKQNKINEQTKEKLIGEPKPPPQLAVNWAPREGGGRRQEETRTAYLGWQWRSSAAFLGAVRVACSRHQEA